jgi:hypothetical protein
MISETAGAGLHERVRKVFVRHHCNSRVCEFHCLDLCSVETLPLGSEKCAAGSRGHQFVTR